MPKLETAVTATTTTEVKLSPKVRKRLLKELKTYGALSAQRKALDAAMKKHKGNVEDIMNEVGESSLSVEGFKTTLVAPVRKKFNPKKFVQLGGDLDIFNKANEEVSTTPYVKISTPGEKEDEE